jgi:ribosomal 30S subunit maturation factor RimM
MKKETAVEWLIQQLTPSISLQKKHIDELEEQAKEIEKNQIINAYESGVGDSYDYTSEEGEFYYNDIYEKY